MKTAVFSYNPFLDATCRYIIPALLILLFSYTGLIKLIDHGLFLFNLYVTRLPHAFARFVSYAIPVVELLTAILLCTQHWRSAGLVFSTVLMLFFTVYVIVIQYSDHRPCSCGGVISAMSWKQHIWFNLSFLLLSGFALYYQRYLRAYKGVS